LRWWFRLLQLALLIVVVWFVYRALAPDLARLNREDFARYRPAALPLLLSFALLLTMYFIHALVWRRMTEALGSRTLSLRSAAHIFFVSGLGRYIPGKLWQMAGMAVLAQRAGISPVAATAASLLGQLGFMTMGMIFLAILLPTRYGANAAMAGVLLIALAVAVFIVGGTERGKALRHRVLSRLGPRVAEAATLLDRMTLPRTVGWWAAYGLSWIVLGAGFAVFVSAFVPETLRAPHYLAGTIAASYLAGFISPTPAGVGGRELIMMALLSDVMPPAAGLVVAIASRVWFTAAELLPLAFIPMLPHHATLDPGRTV
jgi:uncharacterized membrane protein YbhN (UPF0104 family)